MPPLLSIGDFAHLTHLSIRTLRRYHDSGLLVPARVDEATGYRWYAAAQIPSAQVIHRLRELDVPLADVQQVLAATDPADRAELIAGHLRRLEDELSRTRAAVSSLRRLLTPVPAEVTLRRDPATPIAAAEATVAMPDVMAWYDQAMTQLYAAVPAPAGPPGGLYDNALYSDGRGHVLVYLPVEAGFPGATTLPAAELAVTVHPGDHDTIDVTYGQLGKWVVEHALAVAGPVRERYLCGPRDTPDPALWRTEIGWPVFSVAPAAPAR